MFEKNLKQEIFLTHSNGSYISMYFTSNNLETSQIVNCCDSFKFIINFKNLGLFNSVYFDNVCHLDNATTRENKHKTFNLDVGVFFCTTNSIQSHLLYKILDYDIKEIVLNIELSNVDLAKRLNEKVPRYRMVVR